MSKWLDEVVNRLIKQPYVINLFKNESEAIEEVRFMVVESGLDEDEISDYFLALHNKK
jgi:hypothetical protein